MTTCPSNAVWSGNDCPPHALCIPARYHPHLSALAALNASHLCSCDFQLDMTRETVGAAGSPCSPSTWTHVFAGCWGVLCVLAFVATASFVVRSVGVARMGRLRVDGLGLTAGFGCLALFFLGLNTLALVLLVETEGQVYFAVYKAYVFSQAAMLLLSVLMMSNFLVSTIVVLTSSKSMRASRVPLKKITALAFLSGVLCIAGAVPLTTLRMQTICNLFLSTWLLINIVVTRYIPWLLQKLRYMRRATRLSGASDARLEGALHLLHRCSQRMMVSMVFTMAGAAVFITSWYIGMAQGNRYLTGGVRQGALIVQYVGVLFMDTALLHSVFRLLLTRSHGGKNRSSSASDASSLEHGSGVRRNSNSVANASWPENNDVDATASSPELEISRTDVTKNLAKTATKEDESHFTDSDRAFSIPRK